MSWGCQIGLKIRQTLKSGIAASGSPPLCTLANGVCKSRYGKERGKWDGGEGWISYYAKRDPAVCVASSQRKQLLGKVCQISRRVRFSSAFWRQKYRKRKKEISQFASLQNDPNDSSFLSKNKAIWMNEINWLKTFPQIVEKIRYFLFLDFHLKMSLPEGPLTNSNSLKTASAGRLSSSQVSSSTLLFLRIMPDISSALHQRSFRTFL